MNPNFKKKKPLPYKNLGELYIEAVQGKPSINRLPIVETGSVLITRDNGAEDVLRQNVSDKDLNKITRIINNTDNEVPIKDLLKQSGFSSERTFVTLTIEAFNEQNIDSIKLKEVILQKKNNELKLFEDKLNSEGVFNIKEDVLVPVLSAFTDTPRELIDNLFKITPPQKTIGVGPGEVCIALFTNFAKGSTGDLINGDKKIEVKANGGRVGKSGYSLMFPAHAKIVLKNGTSIVQSKYVSTIKKALQEIETHINYKNIIGLNDYIESIKSSIDNAQIEPEKIKELIQQGEKIYELRYELRLPRVINYQLDRIINALNSSMKSLSTGKPPAWSQTVQDFFFNHPLNREQIINGLIELRSEPDGDLDSLRAALSEIITDENYKNYFKEEDKRKKLDMLTLAIQTASYQCHEKFNYLLVINKRYEAVSLKFDSADDIGASFNQMLYYIDNYKYKLTTNLANDSSRKAISIELP